MYVHIKDRLAIIIFTYVRTYMKQNLIDLIIIYWNTYVSKFLSIEIYGSCICLLLLFPPVDDEKQCVLMCGVFLKVVVAVIVQPGEGVDEASVEESLVVVFLQQARTKMQEISLVWRLLREKQSPHECDFLFLNLFLYLMVRLHNNQFLVGRLSSPT